MKVLVVDNGSLYIDNLIELLKPANIDKICYFDLVDMKNFGKYDLVVLSGGSVTPVIGSGETYDREIELIKNLNVPIVGICLGFELIAFAYGSEIEMLESRIKGLVNIHILDKSAPVFKDVPEYVRAYGNHLYSVTALSPELISLAESEHGIEIIKHREKPIYGFQFHPEIDGHISDGDNIFKNLIKCL
jgi:GMP synthase (glutamine-hydrolysing)